MSPDADDARARRNLAVLVAAQVVLGSQLPVTFILGGLAGQLLAPARCLATLPISVIILGSMLSAPLLSSLMQLRGRRAGFVLGAAGGGVGSALCALALVRGSFGLFLAGSLLTGLYMSAQGFYRFAAADGGSPSFRPKAISWVMAAGLASAILGPQMVKATADALAPVPFAGAYLAAALLNLARRLDLLLPRQPAPAAAGARQPAGPHPARALADAAHRGGDDLRDGRLRADEPGDDLDAARRRRLRLHHRQCRRRRLLARARHVRAVVLHRQPRSPASAPSGSSPSASRSSPPPARWASPA